MSRGGARKGAGRKKLTPPERIDLRLTKELKQQLVKESQELSLSINQYLLQILEQRNKNLSIDK
jgi:predicted HicB family RNase H-like nuclease